MFSRTVIVSASNASQHAKLLDDLAKVRYRLFVETLQWALPLASHGREVDQFDDERATYIVNLDLQGNIRAAVRLHDTTGPTLLTTVYKHLVVGEVPQSSHIWEGTRMLVHPDLPAADSAIAFGELLSACVSYGLSRGIECWVSVSDPILERALRRAGAATRRLGPVIEVEAGVNALALRLDCDIATLQRIDAGLQRLRETRGGIHRLVA